MKVSVILSFCILLLVACSNAQMTKRSYLEPNILEPSLKIFHFSDGTQLSVLLPANGLFLSPDPKTNLDEIAEFGSIFRSKYDQPWGLFGQHPHMFSINLMLRHTADHPLDKINDIEGSFVKDVSGNKWQCYKYLKDVEGREGRRWVCVTEFNEKFSAVFNASMYPWVKINEDQFNQWEDQFFNALDSISIVKLLEED